MLFKVGDIVSRNSYNNDTLFKIVSIEDGLINFKGVEVRLYADSPPGDLKLEKDLSLKNEDEELIEEVNETINEIPIVVDEINKKFGDNAILKASSLLNYSTIKMRNKKMGGHNK